jgi:hypothetical protein
MVVVAAAAAAAAVERAEHAMPQARCCFARCVMALLQAVPPALLSTHYWGIHPETNSTRDAPPEMTEGRCSSPEHPNEV